MNEDCMNTPETWEDWIQQNSITEQYTITQMVKMIQEDAVNAAADIADSFADYDGSRDGRAIGKAIREKLLTHTQTNDTLKSVRFSS